MRQLGRYRRRSRHRFISSGSFAAIHTEDLVVIETEDGVVIEKEK